MVGRADVVPASEGQSPFQPVMREGMLFGRGACDAKGQIAALFEALLTPRIEGLPSTTSTGPQWLCARSSWAGAEPHEQESRLTSRESVLTAIAHKVKEQER